MPDPKPIELKPPERVEGPTPGGGAYAVKYFRFDGSLRETVEYDADGGELCRSGAQSRDVPSPDPPLES